MAGQIESPQRYDRLFAYAQAAARGIARSGNRAQSARAVRVRAAALALLDHSSGPSVADAWPRTAAHDALDALIEDWPDIAAGDADGADVMSRRPGLWRRLMTEWPLMDYADLAVRTVTEQMPDRGRLLEVGSGVGNTTARLAATYGARLTWSDRDAALVRNGEWGGSGRIFDFDAPPPDDLNDFAGIVATNAVHCAADPGRTLRWLRDLLAPGGLLVLAEGSSPTREDGRPWALDMLFSAFDGWWDRGGFRTRREWLALLAGQGFTELGSVRLAAGADDLGGVLVARRCAD